MQQGSYAPLLRIVAVTVLMFGLIALGEAFVIASRVSHPTSAASPPLIDPDSAIIVFGLVVFRQTLMTFALLMVISSMADSLTSINKKVERIADAVRA